MNLIKISIFIFVLSIQLTFSYGQTQYDWKSYNLKGRVAAFHEYTYEAKEKFGEASKGRLENELQFKFNENGNIIESQLFDINYGLLTRTYTYDEKGNLIEANDRKNRIIYKSDLNGKVFEEADYNIEGDLQSKTKYFYNVNGQETEVLKNLLGIEIKTTYKYDLNGNKVQMVSFMGDTKLGIVTTKYDSKGNIIEDLEDNEVSHIKKKSVYKYIFDEQGNFMSKTVFSSYSSSGIKYDLAAKEIIERKIDYELTKEQKEKLRIDEERRILAEEQRNKVEIEKGKLRQEQERILKEKLEWEKKENERKELLSFLKLRKTKYFDLDSLSKVDFSKFQNTVQEIVYSKIQDSQFRDLNINGILLVTADTVGLVNINTAKLIADQSEVLKLIANMPNSFTLPPQKIRGYTVNTKASTNIRYTKTIVNFKLKKSNEIVYSKNEPSEKIKSLIRKTYLIDSKGQNSGNYTVEYLCRYINSIKYEEVKTLKHKVGVDVVKVLGSVIDSY